jgi:hypothetical protein
LLLVPSLYMILDDLDRWWTTRESPTGIALHEAQN